MDFKDFQNRLGQRQFPLQFPGSWVDGQWLDPPGASDLKGSINPSNGKPIIEPKTDKRVVQAVLEAATQAGGRLEKMTFAQRLDLVKKMRQALADFQQVSLDAMQVEAGKPLWEAQKDFDIAMQFLDHVCSRGPEIESELLAPAKINGLKGDYFLTPAGIAIAFLPFSTPITSFAYYFAGSMLAGCPLVLCPSSHAVLSGLLYGFLDQLTELPKGALSIVFGNFDSFKKFISDKRIQAIIYTGSREHCELIRRESRLVDGRQLILQSGGKNAVLVHSSANIDTAVQAVLIGALKTAGQLCTSTSRVFIHRSLLKEFTDQLVHAINEIPVGATDIPAAKGARAPILGPLYSQKAVEKFLRYQTMAHRESKTDLVWGKALEQNFGGCFVRPGLHLMEKFDKSSGYQSNVLFCPDIAMYEYDVLDEAIEQINTTDAPFVVSFIGDPDILQARKKQFAAPNLLVNLPTTDAEMAGFPAGRHKSGNHRFNGAGLALLLSFPSLLKCAEADAEPLKYGV